MSFRPDPLSATGVTAPRHVKILVVGDIARWATLGRPDADLGALAFVDLDELHDENITEIAPDVVLSPLVATGFDAIDVAERLQSTRFTGRYCVMASVAIPDIDLIRREINAVAPQLDVDLLVFATAATGSG